MSPDVAEDQKKSWVLGKRRSNPTTAPFLQKGWAELVPTCMILPALLSNSTWHSPFGWARSPSDTPCLREGCECVCCLGSMSGSSPRPANIPSKLRAVHCMYPLQTVHRILSRLQGSLLASLPQPLPRTKSQDLALHCTVHCYLATCVTVKKKSRIRDTSNLSTDADRRTDTILERLRDLSKNPAYRRHQLSRLMWIVGTIQI